ncbi:MAG: hypothetical protein ACXVGC_13215, partial [Mycobacteriaceae bacterium]
AFAPPYRPIPYGGWIDAVEPMIVMLPPGRISGSAFCTLVEHALDVDRKGPVELLLGDRAEDGMVAASVLRLRFVDYV